MPSMQKHRVEVQSVRSDSTFNKLGFNQEFSGGVTILTGYAPQTLTIRISIEVNMLLIAKEVITARMLMNGEEPMFDLKRVCDAYNSIDFNRLLRDAMPEDLRQRVKITQE